MVVDVVQPLDLLRLLANPIRWGIVTYLSESDRQVHEIIQYTNEPQNQVSYHLKQLRIAQLVTEHRSAFDARDIYYHLDLDRLRSLYLNVGKAVHPTMLPTSPRHHPYGFIQQPRVLFLCTHNSARSQMAEGLLRVFSQAEVAVFSAGTNPTTLHPSAIEAMDRLGVDIRSQWAKPLSHIQSLSFNVLITVCDRAREQCPTLSLPEHQLHWSLRDPLDVVGDDSKQRLAFHTLADDLAQRVYNLLGLLSDWYGHAVA